MHQAVNGGTGANHIMLGSGTAIRLYRRQGQPGGAAKQRDRKSQSAVRNQQLVYAGWIRRRQLQPMCRSHPGGVDAVYAYLNALPYKTSATICQPKAYYLLNNYNPGYFGDGSVNTSEFTIPPVPQITIADSLNNANVDWKYYGDGWNLYVQDPNYNNPWNNYCNICNFAQYETSIMTDATQRQLHLARCHRPL